MTAAGQAGIPPVRFHDMRHTFATRMVQAGVDLPTLQEILGHASIVTTTRYTHPTPPHSRAAMDRLVFSMFGSGPKVAREKPEKL